MTISYIFYTTLPDTTAVLPSLLPGESLTPTPLPTIEVNTTREVSNRQTIILISTIITGSLIVVSVVVVVLISVIYWHKRGSSGLSRGMCRLFACM